MTNSSFTVHVWQILVSGYVYVVYPSLRSFLPLHSLVFIHKNLKCHIFSPFSFCTYCIENLLRLASYIICTVDTSILLRTLQMSLTQIITLPVTLTHWLVVTHWPVDDCICVHFRMLSFIQIFHIPY